MGRVGNAVQINVEGIAPSRSPKLVVRRTTTESLPNPSPKCQRQDLSLQSKQVTWPDEGKQFTGILGSMSPKQKTEVLIGV